VVRSRTTYSAGRASAPWRNVATLGAVKPAQPPADRLDATLYNPLGIVHGGLLCTLLDTAAGRAVHSMLPAGAGFSSIEIKVSFVKPLQANTGEIDVHGQALKVGRRVAFAQAHARDRNGELVGHATTSLAINRP
jgi:uncharacterized protein (TIGR00369 family)